MPAAPPPSEKSGRLWYLFAVLALGALVALAVWRAGLVERSYEEYTGCIGCLRDASLAHDAWPIALVMMAILVSRLVGHWLWRLLFALPAVAVAVAMSIDTVVFRLLNQRMYLQEVFRFAGETEGSWSVARTLLGNPADAALLALAFAAPLLALLATLWRGKQRLPFVLAATLFFGAVPLILGAKVAEPEYVLGESWRNVLEVNRPAPLDRPYSEAKVTELRAKPPLAKTCEPGLDQRPNVIVLLIESMSAYHSKLYSDLYDATPKLDALARQQRYVPDFIANGFHSDGGLISVFNGRVPVPAINRMSSIDAFAGFEQPSDDFYSRIEALGYDTAFFTGGDLGFLGKDRWATTLGFDFVEGANSAHYEGLARGQFGAPEDAALFLRVLDWIEEHDPQKPFFAGMLTVETHPPFVVPNSGGRLDEVEAFRHIDHVIADFHQKLLERGFYRNGILIVSGDHRSMTPLKPGERERFGDSAFARVPMVILGPDGATPGPIAGRFQHTDILPSVLQLADSEVCRTPMQGFMLGPEPKPATFALHTSGVRRELVAVYTDAGEARIILDGDNTRWEGPQPEGAQAVMDALVLDRIERGPVRSNRFEYLWKAFGYGE